MSLIHLNAIHSRTTDARRSDVDGFGCTAQCDVCGCSDVWVDEVHRGGQLLLAECSRCDHRWTARLSAGSGRDAGDHAVEPTRLDAAADVQEVATAA